MCGASPSTGVGTWWMSNGRAVDLTPSEFDLLAALMSAPGRVFSRLELLDRVQGTAYEGYERTIDVHVKNLRGKIEPDSAQAHLRRDGLRSGLSFCPGDHQVRSLGIKLVLAFLIVSLTGHRFDGLCWHGRRRPTNSATSSSAKIARSLSASSVTTTLRPPAGKASIAMCLDAAAAIR